MLIKELEKETLEKNTTESLFINFYNNLIKYENENRIILIADRVNAYIGDLIEELSCLEEITSFEASSPSCECTIKEIKDELEVVNEKINFIVSEAFNEQSEEILENIILNIKLELLPKIEAYKEDLEISYDYYSKIKSNFNKDLLELKSNFSKLIDSKNKSNLEKIKVKINESAKSLLKDKKVNIEDIGIDSIETIKNKILNIDELNKEIFDIYKKIKEESLRLFNDIRENIDGICSEEDESFEDEALINISTLNKRYIKFLESNKSFIKNKIIKDIQSILGADSIENKLEIELIYAQDFMKEEYTKNLNIFLKELEAKGNLNVYKKFKSLYGDMSTFQEQILILNNIYLKIKGFNLVDFGKITLVDYLNHSK